MNEEKLKEEYTKFWPLIEHNYVDKSPLMLAIEHELNLVVLDLLAKDTSKSKINESNKAGITPLMVACQYNAPCVSILLGLGASVTAQNVKKKNALMYAITYSPKLAPLLIEHGAVKSNLINHQDSMGWSPLFYAACYSSELILPLIDLGADLSLKTDSNHTLLDVAKGNTEALKILLDYETGKLQENLLENSHKKHKML